MEQNKIQDENVFNVVCQYAERAQRGFKKYGTTTERTDIDLVGWLQHLQEELMDATVNIERIKHELKSKPNNGTGMQENTQAKSTNNSVSLNEYLDFTNGTAIYPEAGSGSNLELYYLSLGLVSEAGEVAGKVKKLIRDGKYDPAGIVKELGDVFWYAVRLVDAVGYSPDDALTISLAMLIVSASSGE